MAEVRVTGSDGVTTEVVSDFDTLNDSGSLTVESEDYNYDGGDFADDPEPGDSSFWIGTEGVDYFDTTPDTWNDYRFDDTVEMGNTNDVLRPIHLDGGWEDWQITGIETDEWWNEILGAGGRRLEPSDPRRRRLQKELPCPTVSANRPVPQMGGSPRFDRLT